MLQYCHDPQPSIIGGEQRSYKHTSYVILIIKTSATEGYFLKNLTSITPLTFILPYVGCYIPTLTKKYVVCDIECKRAMDAQIIRSHLKCCMYHCCLCGYLSCWYLHCLRAVSSMHVNPQLTLSYVAIYLWASQLQWRGERWEEMKMWERVLTMFLRMIF